MKSVATCLGENLKTLRTERGLTQEAFAREAGMSVSFVQLVERGKKWVGPQTIAVFARVLRVSETRLFKDCEEAAELDAKQILLELSRALGVALPRDTLTKATVRTPLGFYTALYDHMPEDLARAFSDRCRQPDWSWEEMRRLLS